MCYKGHLICLAIEERNGTFKLLKLVHDYSYFHPLVQRRFIAVVFLQCIIYSSVYLCCAMSRDDNLLIICSICYAINIR